MARRTGLFWRVYYGIYWGMAIVVGASVAFSVTYHVFRQPAEAHAQAPSDVSVCRAELKTLYRELRSEAAKTMGHSDAPAQIETGWRTWSEDWRARLTSLRTRCQLRKDKSRKELRQLTSDIDRLQLAYTTAFKGFADVGRKPLANIERIFGPDQPD